MYQPIDNTALTDCQPMPKLEKGDLETLIPWAKRVGDAHYDCRLKHAYLADWVRISRANQAPIDE